MIRQLDAVLRGTSWTRKIWHVLLIHFLDNMVLSLGAVMLFNIIEVFS